MTDDPATGGHEYPSYLGYPGGPAEPTAPTTPAVQVLPLNADPLVTPPDAELSGWMERIIEVIKRSWGPLALIALITVVLPALVLSMLSAGASFAPTTQNDNGTVQFNAAATGVAVGLGCAAVIVTIVAAYLAALGSTAAVWVITQQAAGRPARVGQALRYGGNRALPVWGWSLLATLLVLVGLCACVLPGLYFLIATSMVVPAVVYERAPGIPRSFSLIHSAFGTALGRLVLLALGLAVLGCLGGLPSVVTDATLANTGSVQRWLGSFAAGVWEALVALPLFILATTGILVTYAELRGRQLARTTGYYLTTGQLLAELG